MNLNYVDLTLLRRFPLFKCTLEYVLVVHPVKSRWLFRLYIWNLVRKGLLCHREGYYQLTELGMFVLYAHTGGK